MSIKIITVNTTDELDELYNDSALTIEGLDVTSVQDFVNYVNNLCTFKTSTHSAYVVTGKRMNEYCGSIGNRKYQDNLTIVSIKLKDLVNISPIIIDRFNFGGRWFDDIVDNNRRK